MRLEDQELLDADGLPPAAQDGLPILVAWSDNGTEMTATDTRQFMALMAIAQHHGRPGTPTDQAHIESFFSHLKGDWPHLTSYRPRRPRCRARPHPGRVQHHARPRSSARASAGRSVPARGSPARTDASGTGHGRSPEPHPPTRPTTTLTVGLKKSAALSKAH
jgi:hypothetical protein